MLKETKQRPQRSRLCFIKSSSTVKFLCVPLPAPLEPNRHDDQEAITDPHNQCQVVHLGVKKGTELVDQDDHEIRTSHRQVPVHHNIILHPLRRYSQQILNPNDTHKKLPESRQDVLRKDSREAQM